jgi:hypothetical protein
VTSYNRLPSRSRGGPVEQNADYLLKRMSAAQISVRSRLLMSVESADKPWFYQTMTREQAEQRLKRASDGVFLVRPSSQPACYAMSLKNQDKTTRSCTSSLARRLLSSRTATGVRRKSPLDQCGRHSESIDAVAAELAAGDARHAGVEFDKELVCK